MLFRSLRHSSPHPLAGSSGGNSAIRLACSRLGWTYKISDSSLIGITQGPHVISPYVRRLRLAAEIRTLRAKSGLTADQMAKRIGRSRADISRLENGHVIDQADVIKVLDVCGVDGEEWTKILTIAREAGESGWWESYKTMGDRQAVFANLESGAATIREYQQICVPGLLQTPEYAMARTDPATALEELSDGTSDGIVAGRLMRQRMFRRPGGPDYEAIVDELAIRRLSAAASGMG